MPAALAVPLLLCRHGRCRAMRRGGSALAATVATLLVSSVVLAKLPAIVASTGRQCEPAQCRSAAVRQLVCTGSSIPRPRRRREVEGFQFEFHLGLDGISLSLVRADDAAHRCRAC